jgi:predicted secreted acid phosphatase
MQPLPPAIIVDLDNTLIATPPPPPIPYDQVDWTEVSRANRHCPAIDGIKMMVRAFLSSGIAVVYMTGRNWNDVGLTTDWLKEHGLLASDLTHLMMRTPGDFRPDPDIKEDLTRQALSMFHIVSVIDDREDNIEMWGRCFPDIVRLHKK